MDYKEFIENIQKDLPHHFQDSLKNAVVTSVEVDKLQGESYSGISIQPENSSVGLTVGLEELYEHFNEGQSMDSILMSIAEYAEGCLADMPQVNPYELVDYESMKPYLTVQLVSKDTNAEMLQTVPYQDMEDMALVYRFSLQKMEDGTASLLVNNDMMERYGITQEQLHQDAMEIAPEQQPFKIQNMNVIIAEMMGMDAEDMEPAPMYVASNETGLNGAAVISYPNFMAEAAKQLDGDFFVLPSSIHECILIPETFGMNAAELKAMVTEVNGREVEPKDRLTNNVYHYDAEAKVFEQAERFESRKLQKDERKSVLEDLSQKKETAIKKVKELSSPKRVEVAL